MSLCRMWILRKSYITLPHLHVTLSTLRNYHYPCDTIFSKLMPLKHQKCPCPHVNFRGLGPKNGSKPRTLPVSKTFSCRKCPLATNKGPFSQVQISNPKEISSIVHYYFPKRSRTERSHSLSRSDSGTSCSELLRAAREVVKGDPCDGSHPNYSPHPSCFPFHGDCEGMGVGWGHYLFEVRDPLQHILLGADGPSVLFLNKPFIFSVQTTTL